MPVNFPNATRGQEGLLTHLQMTGNALEMHRRLLSGFTYADLMALAEAISTDKKTIGERIGINRRVFARRARAPSTRLTTDQSTRLLCLARVLDAGCRLFNGDTVAANVVVRQHSLKGIANKSSALRPTGTSITSFFRPMIVVMLPLGVELAAK